MMQIPYSDRLVTRIRGALLVLLLMAAAGSTARGQSEGRPEDPREAMKAYGRYLLDTDPESQAAALERALSNDPGSAYLHVEKAHLAWNLERDVGKAIDLAEKAAELDPTSEDAHTLLARVYARLAELGGPRQKEHLERAIRHMEILGGLPGAAPVLDDDHWRMLVDLYELQARLQPDKAKESLEGALAALRKISSGEEERIKSVYILMELERTAEAAQVLEGLLEENPDWLDGRRLQAELLADMGNADQAVEAYLQVLEEDPADHRSRIQLGRLLTASGRRDEALQAYKKVLEGDPPPEGRRLALYLSAELQEELLRFPEAEASLRRLVRLSEGTEARMELARFLQTRGRTLEASKEMETLLESLGETQPGRIRTLVRCADLLARQGRVKRGIEILEQALEEEPDSPTAALSLIELYQGLGEHKKAERLAARKRRQLGEPGTFWLLEGQSQLLAGDQAAGRQTLDAYLKETGAKERDLAMVAAAFSAAGLPDLSIEYLRRALETADSENAETRRSLELQLVMALIQSGQRDAAEARLRDLRKAFPDSLEVAFAWTQQILQPGNRWAELLDFVEVLEEEHPGLRAPRIWELEALMELGRLDEAQERLDTAREAFPAAMNFPALEVELLVRRGKRGEALREARELARTDGADLSVLLLLVDRLRSGEAVREALDLLDEMAEPYSGNAQVAFTRGVLLERAGELDAAQEALGEAIRIDPSFHSAMNYLGYTIAENGLDLKEAKKWLERALVLDPNNPAYMDSLGWTLFLMGRVDAAAPYLEAAARRVPEDPVVRMHLARLHEEQDRTEEALEGYLEALRQGLNERVEETRRRVQDLGGVLPGTNP